ncbi:hypothetical protein BTS2_2428 [Bacillus sp. TS-2]|nr:hypothetical protein BTS2_2428 [Bacillus sp. TS-2]
MKTKLRGYIIVSFFVGLVLLCVLMFNILNKNDQELPSAEGGYLDLTKVSWNEEGDNLFKLDGEWTVSFNQLVQSNQTRNEADFITTKIPSLWTRQHEDVVKFTSATYRLLLKLPEDVQHFAIKTNNIRMSNALYIDGEKIGHSGLPKEDHSYTPENTPYVATFTTDGGEVELLLHVANFDYATGGGILNSLYIGDIESIYKLREQSLFYDYVTISAFLIIGLFFLGFYLHLRKQSSLLYFSLLCFSFVLFFATHGEKVLYEYFPNISYAWFQRLQHSSNIVAIFQLLFFQRLLSEYAIRRIGQWLLYIGILLSLLIFLPTTINSIFQNVHGAFFCLVVVYLLFIQVKAIANRTTGSTYLLFGSITLLFYFIVASGEIIGYSLFNWAPPFLPFIYLLTLALFLAHRLTDAYRRNEELTQKLVEVDKLKDEFLAKTSHEFRTPLYGMTAILQTMLSDQEGKMLTLHQKEKINTVMAKVKRLSSLVNDILDLTKLKRRELTLHLEEVDVFTNTYVISEVFSYLYENIEIEVLIQRGLPYIKADENRLRQVLYNLIDNAMKYSNSGKVQINAQVIKDKMIISIKDNGKGIEEERLQRIFDNYEYDHDEKVAGLGLGLSISKELVELQGGRIWVDSKVGVGSTFYFSLPVIAEKTETQSLFKKQRKVEVKERAPLLFPYRVGDPKDKKVIIADDNHSNIKLLVDSLKGEGYYIIAVDNGKDALQQVSENPDTDLVVLDIMMPNISGYEVCKKIRERYNMTELPVLMLTAAILADDIVAAFQSGANDFLHKPIDISELKTRIKNLILMKETSKNALNMEVAFLQAQIKPHFIYNVLNSIMSLSYIDMEKTRKLITNFAQFLRGSFVFMNTDKWVPIQQELSLVNAYIEIEKARYPDQFDFEMKLEEGISGFIPPLLIQPIVENAIRHGIGNKKGQGKIQLIIQTTKDSIHIDITDNGVGMSKEKLREIKSLKHHKGSGVGLANTFKRVKQYPEATISIKSIENKGTSVNMTLPNFKRLEEFR